MSPELRQVADGFAYRVRSFSGYDVNGYRFRTTSYEQSRPNRKTTSSGVFTPGLDGVEYYGIIEEIYELKFYGSKSLNPVIFKCHWFDPEVTRRTYSNVGLVEFDMILYYQETMSILWPNRQHKFIISHMHAKPKSILRIGMLCTRYCRTVNYLSQMMKIIT